MKKEVILILFVLLIIPLVQAEIFTVNQPSELYNIGDTLNLTVTLRPSTDTHAFFIVSLLCGGDEIELFKQPIKLEVEQESLQNLQLTLDPLVIGESSGKCLIELKYDLDEAKTSIFTLSNEVEVSFLVDGLVTDPGEKIKIDGAAIKANAQPLNGIAEAYFSIIEGYESTQVSNGSFTLEIKVPSDASARQYPLTVRAYEKNTQGVTINEGIFTQNITVKQKIHNIDIAIQTPSITPEKTLVYTIRLYDQTGNEITTELATTIFNPDKEPFEKSLITSGESQEVSLPTNAKPGLWQIQASASNYTKTRTVTMEEYPKLSYKLTNTTLVIKNIGNVKYKKPVEITIGNIKELKDISLDIGEEQSLNLFAPEGEYTIGVSDGKNPQQLGQVSLTGQAVAVKEQGEKESSASFVIWLIILIVIAIALLVVIRRLIKKGYLSSLKSLFSKFIPSRTPLSKPSIISQGKKQEVMVLALHLRNLAELESSNSEAIKIINQAIEKAKQANARVHEEGNYTMLIYSIENDNVPLLAVQAGKMIEQQLGKHNSSPHKDKISFGLGLHIGQIISEDRGENKLRFTAIGNLITIVKRIASSSHKTLHISEQAHRRLVGKVKSRHLPEKNIWIVTETPRRGAYDTFIKGFLKRNLDD